MRSKWWRRLCRSGVAFATAALAASSATVALGGDEPHLDLVPSQPPHLAAVVPPPDAPAAPLGVGSEEREPASPLANPSGGSPPILPAMPGSPALLPPDQPERTTEEPAGEPTESAAPPAMEPETPPALVPVPTYPVVVNATVESLIDYFTVRDRERERFGLWLARSGRYLGMIRRILRERGLPEELAYTAMIESGFSPRAVSRVGAKGLWQFMEATARRYGLVVNRWVDERFDPVKSTIAAAQYLGDLHGMFGHWFLAQAAYNAGEARIARAIQLARTSDFWALTQTRHLPQETKLFVPQILAVTVITQAPARYGFEVAMEPPLEFDEVMVRQALDLETIARLAGVPADEVRELNLALRAGITPPFGAYPVRLPAGSGDRFEQALQGANGLTAWVVHRIGRNQSLADIARIYRVSPQRLAEVNQLRGGRLRGATELLVPVVRRGEGGATPAARVTWRENDGPAPAGLTPAVREVVVRRGDTLTAIAARHGVTPHAIAQANGRDLHDPLYPGDRLKLSTP